MMDDDGNVCDVGDFNDDYKRYIVSKLMQFYELAKKKLTRRFYRVGCKTFHREEGYHRRFKS